MLFKFNSMKIFHRPGTYLHLNYFLFLIVMVTAGLTCAWAETPDQPGSKLEITNDALQAKIEAVNARQGFDEALKSKILKFYQSAQDNLDNTEEFKAQATEFKQALKQAPEKIKKLKKEIDQIQPKLAKPVREDFSKITTEELDQRLIIERGKSTSLDEQIKNLENELALQTSRPQHIRTDTITAQQALETAQATLGTLPARQDSKPEIEAQQVYLKTQIAARTAELKMLDAEALSNQTRVELLKTELLLLNMQKNALSPIIASIEALLAKRREQEAKEVQNALSQAEKELSGKHAVIQAITRENIQYSRDLQIITHKIEKYGEQKAQVDAKAGEIEKDFKSAEKKISLAGLSPALGKILREQRRNLPGRNQFTEQSETIQNETALTSLEQFKIEDNLKKLSDIDASLQEIMSRQVDVNLPSEQRMMIQAELRVLMNTQKELLDKLSVAYTTYLRTLGDFDFARQQMITQAEKFAGYLDERLLWVPSSEPINLKYIPGLYHSIQWLLSPINWMAVVNDTLRAIAKTPFLAFIAVLSLVFLQFSRKWIKEQLALIADKVEKIYTDNFTHTLKALGYNLMLVLPVPLLTYYLGWFLSHSGSAQDFSRAIGTGLQSTAIPLFFLQFFYRLFAPAGLARKHFHWQEYNANLLRKQIAWLRFIAVFCVFIISSTGASKVSLHSDTLGRLALIISMIAMAVFFSRVLNPDRGLLQDYIHSNIKGWLFRLRYVWYPAFIVIPFIIIGFAVAGYYLSALELEQKLIITLRLIFLSILLHEIVFRWLTLVNRQLAIENARQKRKINALNEKKPAGAEDPALPVDEQQVDIPKLNAQTHKLLNVFIAFGLVVGFWMIWKNILPAFSFLDQIVLWQHVVNIDNQDSYQPITLTNLISAGLYIFIVVVSVRNFSGIMELLVFRRLSIEAGGRYAVNQLAKYILVSIGFIAVANELGGSWSQVQWLVAALSVGLGFGLQEIFANLVSGIIVLFERPLRVGDTVTISSVTGKVSRIQMRATTLLDWDQKEIIVPNKTFITSQLVNWTLSDSITRIVIPINIAVGSNVEMAYKIMLATVHATPLILSEPAPSVLCIGLGETSVNFSIRIFVSELGHRLPVTHDLLMRLEKALGDHKNAVDEHKIVIPFPLREDSAIPYSLQDAGALKNHQDNT
jgi:potassium efflux system protein